MPNRVATDDDWEDDESGDEWTGDEDEEYVPDNDEGDATTPCPHCNEPIHQESEQCPNCGQYISEEDAPPNRKPWWIVLGAILCLFAVYLWIRS
jgi:hypothetical protein